MSYPKFKNKHLYEALFNPEDYTNYRKYPKNLFKKCILIYSDSVLNYIKRKYKPKKIAITDTFPVYLYKNVAFAQMSGIGAPTAATRIEELIAIGGREFLNIGTAGGLQKEGVFLCTKALRDEGTSYHYLAHGHFTFPDKQLTKKFEKSIIKHGIEFSKGITWTIDAPYRETKKEIEHYSKQGIVTVEMEASALFAVAKFRKAKIASAFVVSDVLRKKWIPKFHKKELKRMLFNLIDTGVDCLK